LNLLFSPPGICRILKIVFSICPGKAELAINTSAMPELPDLQVFSRNLSKALVGKKVEKIYAINKKKLRTPESEFRTRIEGSVLTAVYRDGKELHFAFDNGNVLGLHLMLRGELHIFHKSHEKRFSIIELLFADGTGLAMADFQGQATPTLNPAPREAPDALSREVNFKFLKVGLAKSKAAVKNFLIDQHNLRGIGSAYADEILWKAGISPFAIGNKIPDGYLKALTRAIKTVLKKAEKSIIRTNPEIISGEVRDFMLIHNPKRTHSPAGKKIKIKKSGARKTYYTDGQKLFK
jgi:formamidopyrimidine-DNA glycosylase